MFTRYFYVVLCISLNALLTAPSASAFDAAPAPAAMQTAASALIPIENFFESSAFSGAIISPDGHRLAVPPGRAGTGKHASEGGGLFQ